MKSVRRRGLVALDAGLEHYPDRDTRQRARIFHATMLMLVFSTVVGIPLMAAIGYPPGLDLALYVLGYVTAYLLSARGWFRIARALGFGVLATGIAYFGVISGPSSGLQNAALILAGTPFVVIAPRERLLLAWTVGSLVLVYVFVTHAGLHGNVGLVEELDEARREIVVFGLAAIVLGLLLTVTTYSEHQRTLARRALQANVASMRVILDHTRDALLTVDPEGRILGVPGATLTRWFGSVEEGAALAEYLGEPFPSAGGMLDLVFEALADGFMPEEVVLGQVPTSLRAGRRTWELTLQPVRAGGVLTHFVVVLSEVTEALERARAERVQNAVVRLFVAYRSDPHGVRTFLAEADALAEVLEAGSADTIALRRAAHTLKASTSAYGLDGLTELCHQLEAELELGPPGPGALDPFLTLWRETREAVRPVLAERSEGLSEGDLLEAARGGSWGGTEAQVQELLRVARLEPVRVRMEACRMVALGAAGRMGLPEPVVSVSDGGLRQDPARWGGFWSSLSHVLRNAVAHGLETPVERVAGGKRPAGRLVLDARIRDGELQISVSDDGRGIDWQAVAERARAVGLPSETEADRLAALFSDGLTTRVEADALAGRGVGLAAVKESVESLGGRISVHSMPGRGTCFRFLFPADGVVLVGAPYEPAGEPASNAPFESTGATKAG